MNILHYAHIGMGKTGSTFLQRQLFPTFNCKMISSDTKQSFPSNFDFIRTSNKLWINLLTSSREDRTNNPSFLAYTARDICKSFHNVETFYNNFSNSSILSAEGITGFHPDVCRLNCTLLKLAGVSKVIYIFRRQESWIFSQWNQLIIKEDRLGFYASIEDLFNLENSNQISISANWSAYIEVLDNIFGPENVLALPYELFRDEPISYLNYICSFAQQASIKDYRHFIENKSTDISHYLTYRIDKLNKPKMAKVKKILPAWAQPLFLKKIKINSALSLQEKHVQYNFYSSNMWLQQRVGLDLKKYGYFE